MGDPPAGMPTSIAVTDRADGFDLVRRWRGPSQTVFGVELVVFYFGLLVVACVVSSAMIAAQGTFFDAWPVIVIIGLATYLALMTILNRTTIAMRDHTLSVRHAPLPWPPGRTLAVGEIARIEARRGAVVAVLASGKRVTLLRYLRMARLRAVEGEVVARELGRRLGLDELDGPRDPQRGRRMTSSSHTGSP